MMTDNPLAIAELEAENERLKKLIPSREPLPGEIDAYMQAEAELAEARESAHLAHVDWELMRDQRNEAQAELAALKGRRCETCAERGGPDWNRYVCLLDDNCAADFYCSFWAARAEEGGE